MLCSGFSPVAAAHARVLVLGSLPGRMSLQMQQYYAQPRNAFWKLLGRLYDFDPASPYPERLVILKQNHVALWDVCAAARRSGSLDAAIVAHSVVPNDFSTFFLKHKLVHTVFFNGQMAAALFRRLVLPGLPAQVQKLDYVTLPSSSPAHAAMPFTTKLRSWSVIRRSF
jgi:double-stranded uracil-DNA glycosylase